MRVCNAKNWEKMGPAQFAGLKNIKVESLGNHHVPINHGEALELFKNRMETHSFTPTKEVGLLSPDRLKFVYVSEVQNEGNEYAFNLGFVNYNDRSRALEVISGEKVFVCSNEMYTGIVQESRRRHTTHVWKILEEKFEFGINRFSEFIEARRGQIDMLKEEKFNEPRFAAAILHLHRHSSFGNTDIGRIVTEWDNPSFQYGTHQRSAWNFQNACTYVIKENIEDPVRRISVCKDVDASIQHALVA